jgi:hypothetical protein
MKSAPRDPSSWKSQLTAVARMPFNASRKSRAPSPAVLTTIARSEPPARAIASSRSWPSAPRSGSPNTPITKVRIGRGASAAALANPAMPGMSSGSHEAVAAPREYLDRHPQSFAWAEAEQLISTL